MKFYDCSTAPSPRRARMFIAEKGLDIETVEVDLRNLEQLKPEFREINPYCTVPVLELDDGRRLLSTAAIRAYLEDVHPDPPLLGRTAEEKGVVADLVWHIEFHGFSAVGEGLRNYAKGMKDRALAGPVPYAQIPELAERGRARTEHFLGGMDAMVGDKPYLAGDAFTAADIDAFVTVEFAKWLKLELPTDAANARRWYDSIAARPSAQL